MPAAKPPMAQGPETKEYEAANEKVPDWLAALQGLPGLPVAPKGSAQAHPARDSSNEAANPSQWVSTIAKGRTRPALHESLSEQLQARQEPFALARQEGAEAVRNALHGNYNGSFSTPPTPLNESMGEALALGPGDLEGMLLGHAGAANDQQPGQQRGEPQRVLLESVASTRSGVESPSVERGFADALGDAMGSGMEQAFRELGDQVSLWAAGQTRKASLLLEAGLRQALEVDVSLNGDQAQLVFRTDDASARDAIKAHAYDQLNDMLNRAGLSLESLSVGGRDAGQSGASHQDEAQGTQGRKQEPADPATPGPALHLKTLSGAGLSVYV